MRVLKEHLYFFMVMKKNLHRNHKHHPTQFYPHQHLLKENQKAGTIPKTGLVTLKMYIKVHFLQSIQPTIVYFYAIKGLISMNNASNRLLYKCTYLHYRYRRCLLPS